MVSEGPPATSRGVLEPQVQIVRMEQTPTGEEPRQHEGKSTMMRGLEAPEAEYK
jgi:hypothetical protein